MTPVFCCGFECGVSGAHWSSTGTVSFDTTTKRTGARSLRLNPSASTARVVQTISGVNVIRFYVYFASLPTSSAQLCFLTTSGGVTFKSSDSKIYAGATVLGTTGVSVTTGQWYRIDCKVDVSSGDTVSDVQVDGVACGQATSVGTTPFNSITLGDDFNYTADIYMDDVLASSTLSDYPLGAGYVNHFIPTSDGTHNIAGTGDFQRTTTGTDILNATTTAYQLVDDVPLESGSSVDWINMVAPPNATDYVECVFGPASGISTPTVAPRAVEVIAGIHQAGTASGNMAIRLNDNGTTNDIYSATGAGGSTTVVYKRKHYATAPTGGAWTVAAGAGNFNNLKMRYGSPAAVDANPDQYLDCIMVEAEFEEVTVWTSTTKFLMLMGAGT